MMRCQTEDGCLSRSMTIKANNKIVASCDKIVRDNSCAFDARDQGVGQRRTVHEDASMRMPKSAKLVNAARPDRVHEARDA